MTTIEMVREFMLANDQKVADRPDLSDMLRCHLGHTLLQEENVELYDALKDGDPVATFDALLDLQYVLDWTFLALGFGGIKDEGMREVHRSNMSKLGPEGKPIKRPDGKVVKGPNYSPPDLGPIVERALEGGAK